MICVQMQKAKLTCHVNDLLSKLIFQIYTKIKARFTYINNLRFSFFFRLAEKEKRIGCYTNITNN